VLEFLAYSVLVEYICTLYSDYMYQGTMYSEYCQLNLHNTFINVLPVQPAVHLYSGKNLLHKCTQCTVSTCVVATVYLDRLAAMSNLVLRVLQYSVPSTVTGTGVLQYTKRYSEYNGTMYYSRRRIRERNSGTHKPGPQILLQESRQFRIHVHCTHTCTCTPYSTRYNV
jgi:hypothetical protein